jgi:outer membrane protein assembly complex protein YaeT
MINSKFKQLRRYAFIVILIMLSLCVSVCFAQENTTSTKWLDLPIVDIQYKCDGDFSLDKVRSATVIQSGDIYSRSQIRKSIESIYAIGEFSDVKADVQPKENGIIVTFILANQIKTQSIQLTGNKKITRDDIVEILKLRTGQEFSESLANSDVNTIRDLYKLYGYLNASVTFSTKIDSKTKGVDVTFNVIEGGQPIITEIILTGTNEAVVESRTLLRAMKEIKLGWTYKGQKILDIDAKSVEEIYRQREYLTAKIKRTEALYDPEIIKQYDGRGRHFIAQGITPEEMKNGSVVILIEIDQGKRIYMKINGNKNIGDDEIKKTVALQRMRSVNESVIRRSRDDIEKIYKARGFYLVDVNYSIMKDIVWNFDSEANTNLVPPSNGRTDDWQASDKLKPIEVSEGLLKIPETSSIETSVDIDAKIYPKAQIRMKISSEISAETPTRSVGRLYWTNSKTKKWNQKRSQQFQVIMDNQFHDYEIPTYKNKRWSGIIYNLKLEPVDIPKASVTIEWIKVTTEFIPIVFNIKENRQMRIMKPISIVAPADKKLETDVDQIRKQMLTRKKSIMSFWLLKNFFPSGILDEDIFAGDLRAIQAFYEDNGYTMSVVNETRATVPEKGRIDITIIIDEGPKTLVKEVIVEGNIDEVLKPEEIFSRLNVISKFDSQNITEKDSIYHYKMSSLVPPSNGRTESKPFREYDLVADRSFLSLRYADKGYLAEIEPIRLFSEDKTAVIIIYKITPGKQIKLDENIVITGNKRTKKRIIEKELSKTLTRDKIYSFSELERSTQNIRALGLFDSIKTDAKPIGDSDDLYSLVVSVKERDARSVNLHTGYTSAEGFQGGIEASDINLFGTARRINGKAQIGTQGKKIEAEYNEPKFLSRILGADSVGLINVYPYSEFTETGYKELRKGITAGVSWKFLASSTLKLDYRYDVLDYTLDEKRTVTKIGRLETFFQRDGRDNLLNPRKGTFEGLSLEYANPVLGGVETFTKLSANAMLYKRLFGNVVMALGAKAGRAWGLGNGELALAPELFRMRDYQTPRGYKWATTDIGNILLNGSLEVRIPIYKSFGVALFFDSGQFYHKTSEIGINSMKSSIGLGLRINTPIGPIRLDYGYPVHGDGKRNYWPDIAFGNPF